MCPFQLSKSFSSLTPSLPALGGLAQGSKNLRPPTRFVGEQKTRRQAPGCVAPTGSRHSAKLDAYFRMCPSGLCAESALLQPSQQLA